MQLECEVFPHLADRWLERLGQPQLGGGVQGPHHHPPPDDVWQRENTLFNLNKLSRQVWHYKVTTLSTFIRRYSRYLNEKAMSYRLVAVDFTKNEERWADGVMRTMTTEKLIKTLPIIQNQLDALLDFQPNSMN
ncbi:unnamed protein product [Gadus morhua 'NCC']